MPPMRFLRAGEPDATLLLLLRANVRTPDQTEGDVWAQASALALIEDRIGRTLADHTLPDLDAVAEEIFARSEAEMRRRLAALPEGSWEYGFTTDGLDSPFTFRCRVTLAGGEAMVDFAGTSPEQPRAVNCVYAYTFAMTVFALKALLLPELPNNEGIFRPIRVLAEEGSLLNPRFPAAVGGRAATGHYVPPLVFGALASVLPDRVRAAPGSPLWIVNIAGVDGAGRGFANVLFFNGGTGAGAAQDGADCVSFPSNISATPIEVAERTAPVFIHRKALREDSGGAGRQRGGRGQEVVLECEAEGVQAVFVTERLREAAPGLFGGASGATGAVLLNGAAFDTRRQQRLKRGDVLTLRTPGGGGFGFPE
jgi:N-methylhydantoinase B/oxoprolinase/acetone carboxylase alpha subunit